MHYAIFADATAAAHFFIIVGVVVGLLLSFRYKRFRPWEAALLISIGLLWSYYGNCPLTILEQWLREQAGQAGVNLTSVGFITFYAKKWGLDVSSRVIQQSTFFSGATFFGASIEWFAPFFHREVFKARKEFRKIFGLKKQKRRYA